MRHRRSTLALIPLLLVFASPLPAQRLPKIKPESVGVSSERLQRIDQVMQGYVDQGRLAGAVLLVVRDGSVVFDQSFGKLDLDKGIPMPSDAIFRIASQSKALTSVAIAILMEEGKLLLSDPVSKFIPEFKNSRVAVRGDDREAQGFTIVPARREITIRDLLTHTSGISYGSGPATELFRAAGVHREHAWYFADQKIPVGQMIEKLAQLPFDAQPGEKFIYGFNTDILGYVVEKASGQTLADFIKQRITDPLKMPDTHFYLPPEKVGRFTPVYGMKDGRLELVEPADKNDYVKGPRISYSGGAGLLSTARDYARFLQMLVNGGELEGARILSPKTVELMISNHVGELYSQSFAARRANQYLGFGLGFWVIEHLGQAGEPGSVGAFGWGGAYHTTYWADPAEKLVVVYMTQLMPAGAIDDQGKIRSLVYQSIVSPFHQTTLAGRR